jgi:hypothetical protein
VPAPDTVAGSTPPVHLDLFLTFLASLATLTSMSDKQARRSPLQPRVVHAWSLLHLQAITYLSSLPLARCIHTGHDISTPLLVGPWAQQLWQTGYDPVLSCFIVRSLRLGVPLGYTGPRDLRQHCRNHTSAHEFASFVSRAIKEEVGTGRQLGPYTTPPFPFYRFSPLGTVEKKVPLGSSPGRAKRRKVHDLSSPHDTSVNDGLEYRCVALSRFDTFADMVRSAGPACQMSKADVGKAYRNIPVQPADWPLLGFEWHHLYYWDTVLPFGLGSSSLLFETFSLAARHIINARVPHAKTDNYADDFFQVTSATVGIDQARLSLQHSIRIMEELGFPMPDDKVEGPASSITVLGLLIDSVRMEIRLDPQRLRDMCALVAHWQSKTTYTRKQLESLIGLLQFACTAIRPGRIFLHRMLVLLRAMPRRTSGDKRTGKYAPTVHGFSADSDMRRDLSWWQHHLATWNGTTLMYELQWTSSASLQLSTDACLTGYGARYGNEWFHGQWTDEDVRRAHREQRVSMPYLELLALLYAAATWGHLWARKQITFLCDCQPVVQALTQHSSNLPETQLLERTLIHLAAKHHFHYRVQHIAGTDNRMADALSRCDLQAFHTCLPSANRSATIRVPLPIPTW